MRTPLLDRLSIRVPVIQAPLAGGGDTPALVAAVSEAGGLGFIGGAYLSARQIEDAARDVRGRTRCPFGVNLFAPVAPPAGEAESDAAIERVARYFEELGLPRPAAPTIEPGALDAQFEAALACGASVFSFTLGVLPAKYVAAIRSRGLFLMGTATTVEEARALEAAGCDAIVAQGSEAGGHRGSFAKPFDVSMVGTIALVPQIADAVAVPVVASGGIMDGRGIAAALVLGAQAVQLGTAFLTTAESGVPEAYREAILAAREDDTRITRAFSGRPARGIVNRFMREVDEAPDTILPFPLQNTLTRPMRAAAAKAGRAEYLSLWAGQGVRMARRCGAGELVARLDEEIRAALARLPTTDAAPRA